MDQNHEKWPKWSKMVKNSQITATNDVKSSGTKSCKKMELKSSKKGKERKNG